jgi:hypothetical protein
MSKTNATLAITDHDERSKTKALTALNCFRHAVDVDELFDRAIIFFLCRTTIIATTTATAAVAATIVTATTTAASATLAFGCFRGCAVSHRCSAFSVFSHH